MDASTGRSAVPTSQHAQPAPARPNIVMVICDDLGYGDLGCYGSVQLRTPVVDRLARDGARFAAMYAAAPTCTPSRAGLLTGREATHVGLPDVIRPGDRASLDEGVRTLADRLKGHGYRTGCFGKWHLGDLPDAGPLRHGFDTYLGVPFSHDMERIELWHDEDLVEATVDVASLTAQYTDAAISFIETTSEDPFFAYVAFAMPHEPVVPEPGFAGRSLVGCYGDVVEAIDHHVGRLIGSLERAGKLDDTIVVFTSDHGPRFVGSSGGLRGRKFETWDGGMRVPFLLRWPRVVSAGRVIDAPVSCLDVMPTILASLGEEVSCDGVDLAPILAGDATHDRGPIYFYDGKHVNAVRHGRWKLHVRRHTWGGGDGNAQRALPQLNDMDIDLGEEFNLADRAPDVVARLLSLIQHEQSRGGRPPVEHEPCTTTSAAAAPAR